MAVEVPIASSVLFCYTKLIGLDIRRTSFQCCQIGEIEGNAEYSLLTLLADEKRDSREGKPVWERKEHFSFFYHRCFFKLHHVLSSCRYNRTLLHSLLWLIDIRCISSANEYWRITLSWLWHVFLKHRIQSRTTDVLPCLRTLLPAYRVAYPIGNEFNFVVF